MSQVIVPISAGQNQDMTITLPVNGGNITLQLSITWNAQGGYWYMSVSDNTGNIILDGIPLITGQYPAGDLFRQYQYLNLGSAYIVPSSANLPDNPDTSTLGTPTTPGADSFYLVWSDSENYTGQGVM